MSVEELDKNIEQVGQRKPIEFEHADFFMRCTCGHIHTIDTNVKGLLRFDMYTTDMHNMLLKCPKCEHELEIYFKDAANPPAKEDEPTTESVQEADATTDATDDGSRQGSGEDKTEETKTLDEPVQEKGKDQE